MRTGALLLCVGVVVFAAAWRKPENQATVRKVFIKFTCETDGGATVTVKPWRIKLNSKSEQIEWTLVGSGLNTVEISPKVVARWPFVAPPPLIVTDKKPGIGKGIPATVPAGTYKYNISGVCPGYSGAPPDTVIIDPDMIIPTSLASR
jgi:hypothetical protein